MDTIVGQRGTVPEKLQMVTEVLPPVICKYHPLDFICYFVYFYFK